MASIKEKNNEFLNAFWELASDDKDKRIVSAKYIISHVQEGEKKGSSVDTDYALKRLVRGLGSSRDSARQGFATCLAELLKVGTQIGIEKTIALIDENTKITGSLKGSEERDFLFGKLFGYLAIARSGRIDKDSENAANIVDRLLELHAKRGWIKEVVTEAILSVLSVIPVNTFENVLPKVIGLLGDAPLADYAAWQISLAVGLQNFANTSFSAVVKSMIVAALPEPEIICPATIELITPTLMAATHGFPKIHRVWDYIMSSIFGMDTKERLLTQKRAASLHSKQEEMLKRFSAFIDKHLLPSSQEKRSVALRLCVELVRRTPAELLPLALSSAAVKCIYACRVNKKHTLHQLAGGVLRDIIAAVGSDATCRLALASSFVQSGGVNFDANTGTKTVATLLEGLGEDAVAAHVKFLCSVVGEASSSSVSSAAKELVDKKDKDAQKTKTGGKNSKGGKPKAPSQESTEGGDEAEDDDSEDIDEESAASAARGAVEALYSMAKNSKIANRAFVASACVSVLVRLSCFGAGATKAAAASTSKSSNVSSKKNKDGKKSKGDAADVSDSSSPSAASAGSLLASASSPLPQSIVELIKLIEGSAANEPSEELAELATSKLLALLADLGHFYLSQLAIAPGSDAVKSEKKDGLKEKNNKSKPKEQEKDKKESQTLAHSHSHVSGVTVLDVAVAALRHISESGVALRRAGGDDDEESEDEGDNDIQLLVKSTLKTLAEIAPPAEVSSVVAVIAASSGSNANAINGTATKKKKTAEPEPQSQSHSQLHAAASIVKLRESLQGLLGHALFQCLTSEDVELQAVEDIATAAPALIADAQNNGAKNGKQSDGDDDEEEEDDRPQSTLFDACMELLSVSGDHAVKGVRDSVKRVWNAVCQVCNIEEEVLDSVIATVVGEDGDQAGEDDGEEGSEGKNKKRKRGDDDEEEEDEEGDSDEDEDGSESENEDSEDDDEEEVKLGEEEAMDFLAEDLDEEDDEAVARLVGKNVSVLEHTEEADSALAQMLALRKQNRKKGLLDAKRNQLVVRSRAADILEVIINRCEAPEILLPIFLPLLRCLKKVQASSTQSLQEGRAFEQRLRTLLEQKLFKKKLHLPAAHTTEEAEGVREEVLGICEEIFKGLRSPVAALRPVALAALLCTARGITHCNDEALRVALANGVKAAFVEFSGKKNTHLAPKTFDEMVQRYPDFSVKAFLAELVKGCSEGKSAYLRSESCRLLGEVLKRHKSLHQESVDRLATELPHIVKSLNAAMTSPAPVPSSSGSNGSKQAPSVEAQEDKSQPGNKKNKKQKVDANGAGSAAVVATSEGAATKEVAEVRAKRLKPILNCAKELAVFFKFRAQAAQTNTGAAAAATPGKDQGKNKGSKKGEEKGRKAEAEAQAMKDFSAAIHASTATVHSSSPVVERLLLQIVQLLENANGQGTSINKDKVKNNDGHQSVTNGAVDADVKTHDKQQQQQQHQKKPQKKKTVLDEAEERILAMHDGDDDEKANVEQPIKKRKWHEEDETSRSKGEKKAEKKGNKKNSDGK